MMARAGSGWQYILADLSLILFMVTAAALASAERQKIVDWLARQVATALPARARPTLVAEARSA